MGKESTKKAPNTHAMSMTDKLRIEEFNFADERVKMGEFRGV